MRDERTVGHPIKDDILQMPRDAFPARTGLSDNDAESRENVGAEIRGSAASSTSETYDLPDGLMDVPQVAEYLHVSKASACKPIERQKISAIRIGRLLSVRKGERGETLRAMATTSVRESYGRALCITNRAKPSGPRPYKTRRFSMCAY